MTADAGQETEAIARSRSRSDPGEALWKKFQDFRHRVFFVLSKRLVCSTDQVCRASDRIRRQANDAEFDGLASGDRDKLGPTLRGLNHQGITTSHQVELAESMLRNLGLTKDFARLGCVLRPRQSNREQSACSGTGLRCLRRSLGRTKCPLGGDVAESDHTSDQPWPSRGIEIPEDTHFLGGLHNTTHRPDRVLRLGRRPDARTPRRPRIDGLFHAGGQANSPRANADPGQLRRSATCSERSQRLVGSPTRMGTWRATQRSSSHRGR